ncbi:hypothetical protein ACP4OV_027497 [Aristida adscensionis]
MTPQRVPQHPPMSSAGPTCELRRPGHLHRCINKRHREALRRSMRKERLEARGQSVGNLEYVATSPKSAVILVAIQNGARGALWRGGAVPWTSALLFCLPLLLHAHSISAAGIYRISHDGETPSPAARPRKLRSVFQWPQLNVDRVGQGLTGMLVVSLFYGYLWLQWQAQLISSKTNA